MRSIKAITFDFGGTLCSGKLDSRAFREHLLEYLRGSGYPVTSTTLSKAIDRALETLMRARRKNAELKFEDVYSSVLRRVGVRPTEGTLDYVYGLYTRCFASEPFEGVEETLENLYKRYRLGIISNATSNLPREVLERRKLSRFFTVIVVSRDLGVRKPDPRIFLYTLNKLEVEASEALHIGDSMIEDIVGAKRVGMKTAWIKNEDAEVIEEPDFVLNSVTELPKILTNMNRVREV